MIFSDGDKDPWRVGGVPNASSPDGSVFHIMIRDSAHHQDLRFQDNVYDSKNYSQLEEWSKIALGNGFSSNAVEMENKLYAYECSIFLWDCV